tara:strand:- start:423 stop:746 length:324 start_codon:yes stop_codon:yes gene_type:complete
MKKLVVLLLLPLMVSSQEATQDMYYNYMEKKVIAKDKDTYTYLIALEDGETFYCEFGIYSILDIGDIIVFKKNWLGRYKFSHIKHLVITEIDGERVLNWYSNKDKKE